MVVKTRRNYLLTFIIGFAKIAEGLVAILTLGRFYAKFKVVKN